jgi:hypothetical protein
LEECSDGIHNVKCESRSLGTTSSPCHFFNAVKAELNENLKNDRLLNSKSVSISIVGERVDVQIVNMDRKDKMKIFRIIRGCFIRILNFRFGGKTLELKYSMSKIIDKNCRSGEFSIAHNIE